MISNWNTLQEKSKTLEQTMDENLQTSKEFDRALESVRRWLRESSSAGIWNSACCVTPPLIEEQLKLVYALLARASTQIAGFKTIETLGMRANFMMHVDFVIDY